MIESQFTKLPPRLQLLKQEIADSIPNFQEKITIAWGDVLSELAKATNLIANTGPEYIPRVKFNELDSLPATKVDEIKKKACVIIQGVVDEPTAQGWLDSLKDFVKVNPDIQGYPTDNKQFYELYWTKEQLQARAHPNVLKVSVWANSFYKSRSGHPAPGVDLSTPLSYADRLRIRQPRVTYGTDEWTRFPPHVDGGGIERWEDPTFRQCFQPILEGRWRDHDPYDLDSRLEAKSSMYGRSNHASIFRTWQGWLSLSTAGPGDGSLQVFPDVKLSNAYCMLRPFFSLKEEGLDPMLAENWKYDISTCEFPGILYYDGGFLGPRPTPPLHPHLQLERTMTAIPTVRPGDMVFWHCDVIHAVEQDHNGTADSAVLYIPAVPLTPQNAEYISKKQLDNFLRREMPDDYSGKRQTKTQEAHLKGIGTPDDIEGKEGKLAMGLLPLPVPAAA